MTKLPETASDAGKPIALDVPIEDAWGNSGEEETCMSCDGSGTEYGETCVTCGGLGFTCWPVEGD